MKVLSQKSGYSSAKAQPIVARCFTKVGNLRYLNSWLNWMNSVL